MQLLIALVVSVAASFASRRVLKSHAGICYATTALLTILVGSNALAGLSPTLDRALYPYVQRCLLAFALFTVVMFLGTLPRNSYARRELAPVRGELSIVASLLCAGHIATYAASYLAKGIGRLSELPATMILSFTVSFLLVVLLGLLTATSFAFVRKHMSGTAWKRVQLLAYPFYLLAYIHLSLILLPSASNPTQKAALSVVVYTCIIALYVVLRLRAYALAKATAEPEPLAEPVPAQPRQ